jgi:type IV pilus assembly protein PilC
MSPSKKKELKPDDSTRLREAIISKIRGEEKGEAEAFTAPPAPRGSAASPGETSVLRTEISLFGPNINDMAMFCRQLVTLLDAGIPLLPSLKILSVRTQHPRLKNVVRKVADQVEQGNRFSAALAAHPRVFSPLFVNVARIGEAGGILESSLKRLAEVLESKASIRRRIIAACAYPFAAITVAIIILTVVMTVAIPKFQAVYQDLAVELPKATRMIIAVSEFIRGAYVLYIPAIIAIVAVLYLFRRTAAGKRFFDGCRLRLPLLANVNVKIAIARATRTLGSLVTAGIPLLEALRTLVQSSENVLVAEAVQRVHDTVEKGGKLEDQLRKEHRVFPPLVVDMIAIGDEAGALDIMLNKLADTYDEEVESVLRGLTAIIEPILIVLLGFVVVFIALALLLPYFHLAKVVS